MPDHPELGRYIWVCNCPYCSQPFGAYERDYSDPLKHHVEYCEKRPDNEDDEESI